MLVARIRQLLHRALSGRRRAHRSRRPYLELLEGRLAPASSIDVWTGAGADVNWSTAANWSNSGTQFPKRSNTPLIAALLGGALVIVGGGAYVAYAIVHSSPAAAAKRSTIS